MRLREFVKISTSQLRPVHAGPVHIVPFRFVYTWSRALTFHPLPFIYTVRADQTLYEVQLDGSLVKSRVLPAPPRDGMCQMHSCVPVYVHVYVCLCSARVCVCVDVSRTPVHPDRQQHMNRNLGKE